MKKVAFVITALKPVVSELSIDKDKKTEREKQQKELDSWVEKDLLYKSAKEIWEALQKKYDTEEARTKKYVVSRYLKYQMADDKSVEAQSHEIQKIALEIISEGMTLDEQFQVAILIDKLPPTWKDFKNVLRHKTKEFSLESLITRPCIKEESRKQDQKEEVLVVSNSNPKKSTPAVLKPNGKNFKNQNRNSNSNSNRNNLNTPRNNNQSRNHNRNQPGRQQPPPK
ncbi:uncharacterized protein LOC133818099 [Humulus lupulus]|uniref:uncharacterized protein LOC133818099 n=1 Tax=Humulus lupulus TaxID=3486 RepID=UPI002B413FA1|nr:uncharacterized protein LOC133818099 [Humulus lupulus]